jgi:hypothetical protein
MNCKTSCQLCDRLVISQAVTFAAGTLTVNIPAGSYGDGCKYCLVVAQTIPAETTITAPVVITIGDGTEEYPLVGCDCAQVTACALRTRTRYSTRVSTSAAGGSFKLLGRASCAPNYNLRAIDGTAPTAA